MAARQSNSAELSRRYRYEIKDDDKSSPFLTYLLFTLWWLGLFGTTLAISAALGAPIVGIGICFALMFLCAYIGNTAFFIRYGISKFDEWLKRCFNREQEEKNPYTRLAAQIITIGLGSFIAYVSIMLTKQEIGSRLVMMTDTNLLILGLVSAALLVLCSAGLIYYGKAFRIERRPEPPSEEQPRRFRWLAEGAAFTNIAINFAALLIIGFVIHAPLVICILSAAAYTFGSSTTCRQQILRFFHRLETIMDESESEDRTDVRPWYIMFSDSKFWVDFFFALSNKAQLLLLPVALIVVATVVPGEIVAPILSIMAAVALAWTYHQAKQKGHELRSDTPFIAVATISTLIFLLTSMTYLPVDDVAIGIITVSLYLLMSITSTLVLYDVNQQRKQEQDDAHNQGDAYADAEELSSGSKLVVFAKSASGTMSALTITLGCLFTVLEPNSIPHGWAEANGDEDVMESWWLLTIFLVVGVLIGYSLYEIHERKHDDFYEGLADMWGQVRAICG